MPRPLTDAVRDPLGAQATIFALLLDPGESVRLAQLAWLDTYALPAAARETRLLMADAQRLAPEARLPLGRDGRTRPLPDDAGAVSRLHPLRRGPGASGPQADPVRVYPPATLDPARGHAFRSRPAADGEVHDHSPR